MTIHAPRYLLYQRKVLGRRDRIWALFAANVRLRGFRLGPMILVVLGFVLIFGLLLLEVLISDITTNSPTVGIQAFFPGIDNILLVFFVLLMTALVGAGIVADDLKSKAITLYLSRPITILDYIIGKGAVVVTLLALLAILPGLLTAVLALLLGYASPTVAGEAALAFLGVGLLLTVFFAGLALLLSSLTSRKAFAGVGIFAILLLDEFFAQVLASATNDLSWLYISPWEDVLSVGRTAFQVNPFTPVINSSVAFSVLFGMIVAVYAATYLRISRIQVVTD